jgi:CelD/BcsL family acetyltransferase involved in cellulose biosynthesis
METGDGFIEREFRKERGSTLSCFILTSEEEVASLCEAWNSLHNRAGSNPFAAPHSLKAWFETLGKSEKASWHIVVGRREGQLVALLPLVVSNKRGFRMLRWAGYSCYFGAMELFEDPSDSAALWRKAFESNLYDFAEIKYITENSACCRTLSSLARKRQTNIVTRILTEWPSGQAWIHSFPGKMRREFSRCWRRLEENEGLCEKTYTKGPLPDRILEELVKQKRAWCASQKKSSFFSSPEALSFLKELVKAFADHNQVRLSWLECRGDLIAALLCFFHKNIAYAYIVTRHPAWSVYAPGTQMFIKTISWAIDNGYREINFMSGEESYKFKLINNQGQIQTFSFHRGLYGHLGEFLYYMRIRAEICLKALKDD